MDAQHRHELKSNELAEGLARLPQYLKDNSNAVIGVALILVGLITWPMFSRMAQRKALNEQTGVTASIQSLEADVYNLVRTTQQGDAQAAEQAFSMFQVNIDGLLNQADGVKNPNLAALARIKAAQAIRTELHIRSELTTETLEAQIAKARTAYEAAYKSAQTPTLKAMAQFGLGLCAEELGQTGQAADIYNGIVSHADYQDTVITVQAQRRLDALQENSETVVFAPARPKAPQDLVPGQGMLPSDLGLLGDDVFFQAPAASEPAQPQVPGDVEIPASGDTDEILPTLPAPADAD